jgi:hypothetical protein
MQRLLLLLWLLLPDLLWTCPLLLLLRLLSLL